MMGRDYQKDLEVCSKATPGPIDILKVDEESFILRGADNTYAGVKLLKMTEGDVKFFATAREALPYWINEWQKVSAQATVMRKALIDWQNFGWLKPREENFIRCNMGNTKKALSSTAGQDLLDRIKALEKALQFYADKKYYYITDTFEPSQALSWTVQKDKGEKARSVLDGDTSCTDAQD